MTKLYTTNSLETFFNILELQDSRSGISSGGSQACWFFCSEGFDLKSDNHVGLVFLVKD